MANMPEAPAPASLREPPRLDGEQFNADIMFVKDSGRTKSPYLVLVDERNGMIIGRHLANRSVKVLHPAMETIINFIEALMRRRPRRIFVDRESVLKDFESFASVQVVQSAANRHARVAERAIRTVKDRMRATLTNLPYKLPGLLYKHLADWSIQRINMIPNSKSFPRTPGEIYGIVALSLDEVFKTEFGVAGIFKIPSNQRSEDLSQQGEQGIVVGYEPAHPSNLKIFVPERRHIVIRSQHLVMPVTSELISALIDSLEEDTNDADFLWNSDMELLSTDEEGDDLAGGLDSADTHSVLNLSIQEAYSSLDSALVDAAISTELENMIKYKVWEAIDTTQVDATVLQQVIPSKLFLKEKFDASGNFLKLKARLVAGGHRQNSDSYSEVASPTTDITSVFVALNICTYFENCQFYTGDIPAAYLNSKLSEVVYMTLPVPVTSILLRMQPSLQSCFNQGRITVKLLKSIYGLKQAALDWHIEINSTLTGLCGLTRSTIDPCLFFNTERCILLVNVHAPSL
jgi:hypothetical protein